MTTAKAAGPGLQSTGPAKYFRCPGPAGKAGPAGLF